MLSNRYNNTQSTKSLALLEAQWSAKKVYTKIQNGADRTNTLIYRTDQNQMGVVNLMDSTLSMHAANSSQAISSTFKFMQLIITIALI